MPRLTKAQFEEVFRSDVLPYVIERERAGFPDKPARREAWNNTVDSYIRDRMLPEAAGNWTHPRWLETWSPKRASNTDYATKRRAAKKSPAQLDREIAQALAPRPIRSHATKVERPLFDQIIAHDKVTIVDRFGKQHTGRAVMRGPHGWVLNLGGRHGTPGIATRENTVRVVCGHK